MRGRTSVGHVRGTVADVPVSANDALLGLLPQAWQALVAGCLLVVTVLGVRRLAQRGLTRVTRAVLVTGVLILAVMVIGTLAVSCGSGGSRSAASFPRPSTRA